MDSTGIMPVMNMDGGFGGGNGFMYIFGLLILLGLFNGGGFFGGGNNQYATRDQVQNGFDTQNMQTQTSGILTAVTNGTAQAVAATNQTFHDTLGIIQNRYDELARDISGLAVGQAQALANQNECCCKTQLLIQQTASDNALALAQMEARLNAKMDANEIQNLRDKVSALELGAATSNVVRYPTNTFYSVPSPCFNMCGCGA